MASKEAIANRALQRIGASRITSFDEGSKNANSVKFCYDFLREAELRANFWSFAVKRVNLAADSATPLWGRTYQYSLPEDFLRIAPQDPTYSNPYSDWLIEGKKLLTTEGAPLPFRYVYNITAAEQFDSMFADALAMRIAAEIAEELTGSASKVDVAERAYTFFIQQARKINAIEAGPINPEIDEMVSVRVTGSQYDPTTRRVTS